MKQLKNLELIDDGNYQEAEFIIVDNNFFLSIDKKVEEYKNKRVTIDMDKNNNKYQVIFNNKTNINFKIKDDYSYIFINEAPNIFLSHNSNQTIVEQNDLDLKEINSNNIDSSNNNNINYNDNNNTNNDVIYNNKYKDNNGYR